MIASSAIAAGGAVKQGNEAKAAADFEAAQLNRRAGEARAAGQRASLEERRQGKLVESRATAVNASTGGGYDKTMESILSGIADDTRYRSLSAMYETGSAADSYETDAKMRRITGKNKQTAGYISAGSTMLSSFGSMYGRAPAAQTDLGGQMPWLKSGV